MTLAAKIICACVVFLGACGSMTPEERGIEVTDDYKIYNQEKAMFTLQYTVEDYYGNDLGDLFNKGATVYWTDSQCPYRDEWAVIHEGVCTAGKMFSCDELYVAKIKSDPNHTCGTALLHEFGHCIRQEMNIVVTAEDHEDEEFWALVSEANAISCNRGW